jgi:hypothetical protein
MNPNRRRWLLRLAAVLVLGLIGLLWALQQQTRELVVENQSGQTIEVLKITVADQALTFHDVPPKATRTASSKAKEGDHFNVEGRLADETRVRMDGALGDSLHFLILPGGTIQFRPKGK